MRRPAIMRPARRLGKRRRLVFPAVMRVFVLRVRRRSVALKQRSREFCCSTGNLSHSALPVRHAVGRMLGIAQGLWHP
jgi:hypothetical protein